MKTRHCVSVTRVVAASIIACVALMCTPALSVAADPSDFVPKGDLLARGAGYGQPQGDPQVRALQRGLRTLGQRPGPVDGLYGPLTEAAVERFQRESGLLVDGIVGPRTRRGLNGEMARSVKRRLRALPERARPDGNARPAVSPGANRGSEPSGLGVPVVARDHTQGTDEPGSSSIVFMALLALTLAAGGGGLAAWLRERHRRPTATGVAAPQAGGLAVLGDLTVRKSKTTHMRQRESTHGVVVEGLGRTAVRADRVQKAMLSSALDAEESPSTRTDRRGAAQEARAAGSPNGSAWPAMSDARPVGERIREMRASGMTLQAIADSLNAENVATLRGGATWRPSVVHAASAGRTPGRGRSRPAATPTGGAG